MKNFDTRTYNISDFVEWEARNQLELSPDFQRRSVWSQKAKSYLIDTIVRGKPIPKLLLTQEIQDRRNIRIVVDGQQRLRAILEYVSGSFPISRAHNKEFSGMRFASLPNDIQNEFMKYEIGVDLLYDVPYRDILDIFARLNTYTVKLNGQELINAKYVGYFKQLAYEMGYQYVEYFIDSKLLSKDKISRMLEAELSSDLIIGLIDGIQTSKNIESFYKKYEDNFDNVDEFESKFCKVMDKIITIYPPKELANSNWSRIHLFYTLFSVIAQGMFQPNPLHKLQIPAVLKSTDLRVILDDISAKYDFYTELKQEENVVPGNWANFILRSRRGTTDTIARLERAQFVVNQINNPAD